jgi:hypothetical protein
MGISAGIMGIGGALSGMFGGNSASNVQLPPMFNMPNMSGAAGGAYSGIQGLGQYTGMANSTLGNAASTYGNLYNSPYAGMAQSGANTAAGMGMNAATGAYNAGGALTGAGVGLLPGASAIMQAGFDPQQALYNQTYGQVSNQANAQNAASGLSMTPYGASVAGSDLSNFNINWQNQQLQREATAAGAAGGLVNQAGGAINTGTGIMNAAPGQYATAAGMPYTTQQGIGNQQNQAISQYLGLGSSAQGLSNQQISDYLSYLQTGNQAGSVANQTAQLGLQQQQQGFNQNMQLGQALGTGLYGVGKGFSGNMSGSPLFSSAFG